MSLAGFIVAVGLVLRVFLVDAVVGQVHKLVTQSLHGRRIPTEEKDTWIKSNQIKSNQIWPHASALNSYSKCQQWNILIFLDHHIFITRSFDLSLLNWQTSYHGSILRELIYSKWVCHCVQKHTCSWQIEPVHRRRCKFGAGRRMSRRHRSAGQTCYHWWGRACAGTCKTQPAKRCLTLMANHYQCQVQ